MMLRFSLILAASLCLVGCNQQTKEQADTTEAQPVAPVAPATSTVPEAPAPLTSGEDDMITTSKGLRYKVLQEGTGTVSPTPTDTVHVHYHGTLLNGRVFDSSVRRGQPISFELHQVISGWTEGLQLMKVGDKFKFEIPPQLAYGESGRPGIPPNSTLVFEVELLGIK